MLLVRSEMDFLFCQLSTMVLMNGDFRNSLSNRFSCVLNKNGAWSLSVDVCDGRV